MDADSERNNDLVHKDLVKLRKVVAQLMPEVKKIQPVGGSAASLGGGASQTTQDEKKFDMFGQCGYRHIDSPIGQIFFELNKDIMAQLLIRCPD